MTPQAEIAVLVTCHNRRDLTLRLLEALRNQPLFTERNLFLVDDGSSDGTGDAARAAMPGANVIEGDGSLYWNGGMQRAWDAAKANPRHFDFFLWLNDDVTLYPDTLAALVADADKAVPRGQAVILAAATLDSDHKTITYGGSIRTDPRRPLRLQLAKPTGALLPVDTISGNIVLVSTAANQQLKGLDHHFTHIYGDLDYGLRAKEAAIPVMLACKPGGICTANDLSGGSLDNTLGLFARLAQRWREEKSIHARDWRRFVARHEPGLLPSLKHRIAPYARILAGRPNPASSASTTLGNPS